MLRLLGGDGSTQYFTDVNGAAHKLAYEVCSYCNAGYGGRPSPPGKLKVCEGCRNARYCGRQCQKAHWKQHKKECRRLMTERREQRQSSGWRG